MIPDILFREFQKETEKSRGKGNKMRVAITHGDDPKGAQKLKEMIEEECNNTEVALLNIINNVVGAPTGPNTLSCAWCQI